METDISETNLVIITKRDRIKLFCFLYWRNILLISTPLLLLPVAYAAENNAYKCFYIFLVTVVYWTADVLHQGIISLVPIALYTIVGSKDPGYINHIFVRNELLDYISVMMIIFAIERSNLHRRIAIKLLLLFGCSHYRLSFILFFSTTFSAMWLSDITACGLMTPLVKAILAELERMGILEIHEVIGKAKQTSERHEQKKPRPTNFTIFYFLGIAYSSSIGSIATVVGSQTIQIFKFYSESLFPSSPPIEFPHVILLTLPGVLLMETLLYVWMNSYFLRMFRARSNTALEINITEEEAMYINTLLKTQYHQLGRITYHETIVAVITTVACFLQACLNSTYIESFPGNHSHLKISAPCLICVLLLFVTPVDLDFIGFFKKQGNANEPLPTSTSKSCLNWNHVQNNMDWSMLFMIASSCATLEALQESGMMRELEKPLLALATWPAPVLALIAIVLCKLLTEYAANPCVAYCVLPSFARLSVAGSVNPQYLMMAATLGCSLPFHLVTGSPVNALVAAYVDIPPWKMMSAGIGPSVMTIVVSWFTVAVWSRAIWNDIHLTPLWVLDNPFKDKGT
ncbi:hypothetical protein evm_007401 [Chilo suppressalis]|nr:hypothetical protein evm_007401 [Chilo suppressalis]